MIEHVIIRHQMPQRPFYCHFMDALHVKLPQCPALYKNEDLHRATAVNYVPYTEFKLMPQ